MKRLFIALFAAFLSFSAFAAVNLNTATQSELEGLSGIGPAKAKAIIDFRSKNGPYKTVDDLTKVPGIKKATLDKFRAEVSVGGGAAPAAPAAKPAAPAASVKPNATAPAAPATPVAPAAPAKK